MDGMGSIARLIIIIGVVIVIFGLLVLLFSRIWVGRGHPLPGDILIQRRNVTIWFPIVSSIIISIILTLIFWIIAAFRR